MKALIIDDEKHVREAIKLLADWEQNGIQQIYEASNGEEAIHYIKKYNPEIIFSDMKMPKMDGTQLLAWLKENQSSSKIIIVTGYDDYHYMRKAIHFGSADYLLKPIDPEVLNQALENVVQEWRKEEVDRKKKVSNYQLINQMKPVYRDRKLTQFLNSNVSKEELDSELEFHLARNYTIALVQVNGKTMQAFRNDRDLTYFSILNIINEILIKRNEGIAFRYLSNKGEIVIIYWADKEEVTQSLIRIYVTLHQVLEVSCSICVGIPVMDSSMLKKSYDEAKQLLLDSNLLEKKKIRVYLKKEKDVPSLKSLMAYSSDIKLAVQTGDRKFLSELLERIIKDYTSEQYLSLKQLYQLENEYVIISQRWYKYYQIQQKTYSDMEQRMALFFNQDGTFNIQAYKDRITREIIVFFKRISEKKKMNIMSEIEKYLLENFHRDVKLQELSDYFYISREYISRKFKQEFQVNISDYLANVRIEKAKSLLKNSKLKIFEIANMVGYQDDKYFRKVFKKIVGLTPNEYRALVNGV
ncbi:response regulator transcription factor [Niallia sp. 01092]|uniref:response regulator transcription factor n=1 Tax=unclassified Niallia TaxID=2837522 RepID=UPI003FD4C313